MTWPVRLLWWRFVIRIRHRISTWQVKGWFQALHWFDKAPQVTGHTAGHRLRSFLTVSMTYHTNSPSSSGNVWNTMGRLNTPPQHALWVSDAVGKSCAQQRGTLALVGEAMNDHKSTAKWTYKLRDDSLDHKQEVHFLIMFYQTDWRLNSRYKPDLTNLCVGAGREYRISHDKSRSSFNDTLTCTIESLGCALTNHCDM